jgi:two-component system chemotaxis response regulator CheB
VLFDSVAALGLCGALGVLLTGMGKDGAAALLRMKNAGCYTLIQDKASSVVWGMPGAAFELEAHCEVQALSDLPARLLMLSKQKRQGRNGGHDACA